MPITSNTSSTSLRHRFHTTFRLSIACLLLFLGMATVSRAENLWTSSSPSWATSASRWSTWETTLNVPSLPLLSSPQTDTPRTPSPATSNASSIDPVMLKAGSIAQQRALPRSTMRCWRFVKEALLAAGSVSSYPQTTFAKQAGDELVRSYGFVRLAVRSAAEAPVGAVVVYGGKGPGHVELRTASGFVSDFCHSQPSNMPFIGAYARLEKRKPIQTAQLGGWVNSDS